MADQVTAAVDIDRELLTRLLFKVESDAHRHGWDGPPALLVLYDTRHLDTDRLYRQVFAAHPAFGPATRMGPYVAQRMLSADMLCTRGRQVWQNLYIFASNAAFADDDACSDATGRFNVAVLRDAMRQPGVLGYALLSEGWQREGIGQQELDSLLSDGRHYADIPGSVENRSVACVDVNNLAQAVQRNRGRKPEVVEFHTAFGGITTSMRLLVDMTMRRTPPRDQVNAHYATPVMTYTAAAAEGI